MLALMLEMAGVRALPLTDLSQFDTATRDIPVLALVVDARDGDASTWDAARRVQAASTSAGMQVLVIAGATTDVPTDILSDGARVLRWPFPLTDLLPRLPQP